MLNTEDPVNAIRAHCGNKGRVLCLVRSSRAATRSLGVPALDTAARGTCDYPSGSAQVSELLVAPCYFLLQSGGFLSSVENIEVMALQCITSEDRTGKAVAGQGETEILLLLLLLQITPLPSNSSGMSWPVV